MATQSLENQAHEAAGKHIISLYEQYGKKRSPEIFIGYIRAFGDAFAALMGPTRAAEVLYRLADAQVESISLDSIDPVIRAAIARAAKSVKE